MQAGGARPDIEFLSVSKTFGTVRAVDAGAVAAAAFATDRDRATANDWMMPDEFVK